MTTDNNGWVACSEQMPPKELKEYGEAHNYIIYIENKSKPNYTRVDSGFYEPNIYNNGQLDFRLFNDVFVRDNDNETVTHWQNFPPPPIK